MKFKSNQGFSLIELMVVVAIIGILSVVGVPKYQMFKAKAIIAEAKSALSDIYTLEQAYYLDKDMYASVGESDWGDPDKNPIGFVPAPEQKYKYSITVGTGNNSFTALAVFKNKSSKLASCAKDPGDERSVTETKAFTTVKDGLAGC